MKADFQKLLDLAKVSNDAQSAWLRQILTLAAGGLALLVGMAPQVPQAGPSKWFLAAAWVLLGLGILAGGGATYSEVNLAKRLQAAFQSQLLQSLREPEKHGEMKPVVARPALVFRLCKPVMVMSLLGAVVCVVSFAVLRTLR